jgi:ABC-type transporter Mla subunit MlaD
MATDTKTNVKAATQEAADATQQLADAQEQAARQWTRTQERAIGVFRDAQTNLLRTFAPPSEVIETTYDFAAQALEMQKEFALRYFEWLTPRVPEREEAADKKNGG